MTHSREITIALMTTTIDAHTPEYIVPGKVTCNCSETFRTLIAHSYHVADMMYAGVWVDDVRKMGMKDGWREGYDQGVSDQLTASEEPAGYYFEPNRNNPYER